MANMLMDALSGIGNVLDTPGSVVRGLLTGQAGRALGGIMDPTQRVSGRDMLNQWGVTDENSGTGGDIAGLVAGVATDPLTWAGGGLLKLLGRGGEAASTGTTTASRLSHVAPEAETLLSAAPGVGGYKRLADGTIQRIEALQAGGNGIGANGVQTFAHGPGQALTEAEHWTGPARYSATPGTLTTDLGAAQQAGNVSGLMPLRRDFTMLKGVGLGENGLPAYDRAVGGLAGVADPAGRARQVFGAGGEAALEAAETAGQGGTMHGVYMPSSRTASIMDGALPGTVRHEGLHGIIDAARRSGQTNQLAMLPRVSANLQDMSSPTARALGLLGEETAAHGVGAGRGAANQFRGGLDFLMNPNSAYGEQLSQLSPMIAALYGTSAIPRGAAFGAGLAGGAGAAGLLSQLGG